MAFRHIAGRGLILAALLALTGSAIAAETPPAQAGQPTSGTTSPALPAKPTPPPPQSRIHCVEERSTDSFIPARTCYTQEEWDERQRQAQASMGRTNDQSAFCQGAGRTC